MDPTKKNEAEKSSSEHTDSAPRRMDNSQERTTSMMRFEQALKKLEDRFDVILEYFRRVHDQQQDLMIREHLRRRLPLYAESIGHNDSTPGTSSTPNEMGTDSSPTKMEVSTSDSDNE